MNISSPRIHRPGTKRHGAFAIPVGALCFVSLFVVSNCHSENGVTRNGQLENRTGHPLDAKDQTVAIPEDSDWVAHGVILSRGVEGAWDHYLYGGFAGTIVKKDGRFLLYYQGARDYSERYGTVTQRAIGLAISTDGINFTKYADNPVVNWSPEHSLEEGVASAAAALDNTGQVMLFYGANSRASDWLVNADGRVAVSADGLRFTDLGIALDHRNRKLWGNGDELFPIVSVSGSDAYVYYIPNGTGDSGRLGVAWGPDWRTLRSSAKVNSDTGPVEVWGMGGSAKVGEDLYALFLNDVKRRRIEVRLVRMDQPDRVSAPIRVFTFDDFSQGTVYLDHESRSWFLFYRTADAAAYRVMTAPILRHGKGQ